MLNDVISKYRYTAQILESSPNPKIQLTAIIDFFRYCEDTNHPHLLHVFLPDFVTYLVNIFKNSSIDFVDPYYLTASKFLLSKASALESNEIVRNEIKSIIDILNIRLLVLYYYIGEVENGMLVLKDLLLSRNVAESGVSLNYPDTEYKNSRPANSNSLVDPRLFKLNKAFDVLRQINYELSRQNSFSCAEINILLVESDGSETRKKDFGIVESLECRIEKKRGSNIKNPFIENIIDVQNEGINRIKEELISSSNVILKKFGQVIKAERHQVNLKFRNLSGIYKGTSFGAGASLLIPASYLESINSRTRFRISFSAAFTGSVDTDGYLKKLPESSIEPKIEAAFFSWIKYVIVPEENLEAAKEKLHALNRSYPRKTLDIIGAKNIIDLTENKDIIKTEKDSAYEHSRKVVKRHPITAYTTLSIVLVLISTFLVWTFVPRNFKPYPQISKNWFGITYSPDRDNVWKFNSISRVTGDTIFYGDIALGDMLCHRFELWNNDDVKRQIHIELEGENKDEFEVLWGVDFDQKEAPNYVYPNLKQRLFVKFIPWKSVGEKKAELVFYSSDEPDKKKILHLRGNTGYFTKGYSLKIRGDDIYYVNPNRGNILGHEFTISFWFETNKVNYSVFCDNNTSYSLTKFDIRMDSDSTLSLEIMKPKAEQSEDYVVRSVSKLISNKWHFAAISHKNNVTQFIVDDEIINLKTENDHFQQMEDMFYCGDNDPNQPEALGYRTDDWYENIAELRIYDKSLSTQEIIEKKYGKENYMDNRLLLYHDFEETEGYKAIDKSSGDISGDYAGLPSKSLDYPAIGISNVQPNEDFVKDSYVQVKNKGEVRLNKDLFDGPSSFTIQLEAKAGAKLKSDYEGFYHISGIQYNYTLGFEHGDSIGIIFEDGIHVNIRFPYVKFHLDTLWHRYTVDYSLQENTGRLFIDGNLVALNSFGRYPYDISREQFFISFGKGGQYENPRFIRGESSITNIAIFNRTLSDDEIKKDKPEDIRKMPGILALWDFSRIEGHVAYDEVNNLPLFLWDEFEVCNR